MHISNTDRFHTNNQDHRLLASIANLQDVAILGHIPMWQQWTEAKKPLPTEYGACVLNFDSAHPAAPSPIRDPEKVVFSFFISSVCYNL